MIQIDGIQRQVYIKMTTKEKALAVLLVTGGQTQYKCKGHLQINGCEATGMMEQAG
jgi:hypothetical protein